MPRKPDEQDFFQAGIKTLSTLTVLALSVIALVMLYPIWDVILFAMILTFIFKPLETKLARRMGNFFSALFVTFFILFLIILPVMMIIQMFYANINLFSAFVQSDIIANTLSAFSSFLPEEVIQVGIFNFVRDWLGSIFVSVPILLVKTIVMMMLVYYLLREGERLFAYLYDVLPDQQVAFIKAFIGIGKGNLRAVLYGHFLTSLIISIVTILVVFALRAPHVQTLSVLILMFAILPIIGAWVVLVPLALYYFNLGNTLLAAAYLVLALFISILDDFIRPKLVSRSANIHMAVVLIGFVSGAMLFGVMGIFLGPLLLTLLKTALDAYKVSVKGIQQ